MNIIDLIIIVVLLFGIFIGYKRGFIPSVLSFIGTFVIIILAFWLKNPVGSFLYKTFPFTDFDGSFEGISSLNILVYESIAFLLCYVILSIILKIVIRLSKVAEKLIGKIKLLALTSKILGMIVSVIEYGLLLFVVLLVLALIPKTNYLINNSKYANVILTKIPVISSVTNNIYKAEEEINELLSDDSVDNKDSKALEILLKYNIIDVESVQELVNNNKLEIKEEDIKNVLNEIGVKND